MQSDLLDGQSLTLSPPIRGQLLKWIGNKQRFAHEIISYFPECFDRYFEPFLGTGAVLATLAKPGSMGADISAPLIEIWQTLAKRPERLKAWYAQRWEQMGAGDKAAVYEQIKSSYNSHPNGADLLFICRACYGGVVRFRKSDGGISTPCGPHNPISPEAFSSRVDEWHHRVRVSEFLQKDYRETMSLAEPGDLVYCDPPYRHSQAILYKSQGFSLEELFETVAQCKRRGVYVALSIDGKKKTGKIECSLPIPEGLFEREVYVNCGRSMLKRFQMNGQSLEGEVVADRLLLTY